MDTTIKPVTQRLLALFPRMQKTAFSQMPLHKSPLRPHQFILLNWIAHKPGSGVKEIAEGIGLTAPTISVGVRKLLKKGWVRSVVNPDDKRAKPLFLSDKGEELMHNAKGSRIKMMDNFLSGLDAKEQETLIALLEKAVDNYEMNSLPEEE